jgi:hypothetical protein
MDGLRSFNVKEGGTCSYRLWLILCCFATQSALPITNAQTKMCRVTSHVQQGLGAADGMSVTVCFWDLCTTFVWWPLRLVKEKHAVVFNLLAPEFFIQILAHSVCKVWIIQEPKKVALWNKLHFEEKNGECAACLKYSVLIFAEKIYIKCNIWRVAVRPSYIYRTQGS